jgi:serine/threonine protein kinase/tetratricopeptide (TPR) repeat protein
MNSESFERIADQFLDDCRRGDDPEIEAIADEHPELSDEIKDVLPTALLMEQFKRQKNFGRVEADRGVKFGSSYLRKLGDYRLIREIGRGGMGIVYEAEQESLKRRVAVKVLRPSLTMDEKTAARFEREAQAAAGLHHTNIVPVFGVGQQDDIRYYVMQLIEGKTLDTITKETAASKEQAESSNQQEQSPSTISNVRVSQSQTPASSMLLDGPQAVSSDSSVAQHHSLSDSRATQSGSTELSVTQSQGAVSETKTTRAPNDWRWMASVGIEVCDAMDHAHHHGILHRDIKPGNILVDDDGGVWITDFGLAKPADAADITASGDAVGTLRYMAPEQLDGISSVQTDLYSLGITLYELATGAPAYVHKDRAQLLQMIVKQEPVRPRKLVPDIPRDFETIILKSISREPSRRYQTASEFEDDLHRFLEYRPIRARRAGAVERMWRWCRRNPAVAIPTMVSFVLLLCLAMVASTGYLKVKSALAETDAQRERAENNRKQAEDNLATAESERKSAQTQRELAEASLGRVRLEQARAQSNLELSLDALEAVFHRFAPDAVAQNDGDNGEESFDPRFDVVITQQDVALLKSMLEFYDEFAQQNKDDERLQREAARAYRRVGDIHTRLGAFAEAQGAYDRALDMYQETCKGLPIEHELKRQLAAVQNDLGLVLKMRGRFTQARNLHLRALGSLRQQLALAPDSVEINLELVRTYNFLGYTIWGSFQRNEDPNLPTLATAAEENHRAALQTLTKLIANDANNPEYQLILARSHRDIVPVLLYRRRFPTSQSSTAGEELTAEQKQELDAQRRASYARRQAEASESMKKSREILEDLVARYPRVPTYKYELVRTLTRRFRRRTTSETDRQEYYATIIRNHKTALGLAEELASDYPDVPEYSARVAYTTRTLSDYYGSLGDAENAEKYARLAFVKMSDQANAYSQVPRYRLYLAFMAQRLIEILNESNRIDESRDLVLQMLESTENLEFEEEERRQQGMLRFVRDRLTRTLCKIELGEVGSPADESAAQN